MSSLTICKLVLMVDKGNSNGKEEPLADVIEFLFFFFRSESGECSRMSSDISVSDALYSPAGKRYVAKVS